MTSECLNKPLLVDEARLRTLRDQLYAELTSARRPGVEPVRPTNAYAIAFAEQPASAICQRVAYLYSPGSRPNRARAPERGFLYVFRDRRDAPESLVKIGSTVGVERRMQQWRRELRVASPDDLSLLYTYRCGHIRLAEAIVHALLFCQWDAKRVNEATARRALEYFAVDDWVALGQVIGAVCAHVDWWLETAASQKIDPPTKQRRR